MKLFKKKSFQVIVLLAFIIGLAVQSIAQTVNKSIWKEISVKQTAHFSEGSTKPTKFRSLFMEVEAMKALLQTAPMENADRTSDLGIEIQLPMPDSTWSRFRIYETYVMHPDLAAQFPEIKTYAGQGIDDVHATIRLDFTPHGFHAMVISPNGIIFIDPYSQNSTRGYICYYKRDIKPASSFVCGVKADRNPDDYRDVLPQELYAQRSSGNNLRTYRLALACTGEYAATKGGTVALAMAGMTTTMNRVNGVYETEVAIRMVMVANNNLIVYTNSGTDPYTNSNGSTMLGENQTTCDGVIGSANYDIGHVFSTGGGGVAGLSVVCSASNKARGVTGQPSPVGDGFDIDYVAHEMGHQFGGNHTFNSVTGSCGGGNRVSSAAYEPGSGITIMAYAGICSSDDLAAHSIAYFHTKSFDEIVIFSTTGTGNTCPANTISGNAAPVVTSMGSPKTIPVSTPFILTGAATDANSDPLTYSWEQFDLGAASTWNATQTAGSTWPLFRPFPPASSPSRTFPQVSDILNNTTTVGEVLPAVARTLHFRLTARDNRSGGGGVMHPDTTLNISVVNNGGAFAVSAPNTAVSWTGNSTQTVAWTVNGTTASPINCANVKVSLSTNGGITFPTVITASTPNDGTENITVPNIPTAQARIKVEAVGNIFFDLSNTNFTILLAPVLSVITTSALPFSTICEGSAASVSFTTNGSANAGNIFTAQLSDSGGSFASPVSIGTLSGINAGTINATIPLGSLIGIKYRIRVVSSNPAVTGSTNGTNFSILNFPASAGSINGIATVCQGQNGVSYSVPLIINATGYAWTLPANASISAGTNTNSITVGYFSNAVSGNISVAGFNACGSGSNSLNFPVAVNSSPVISNFIPSFGAIGSMVTINGNNFNTATNVMFNGLNAAFVINNDYEISATVPTGATSGFVSVGNPSCTATASTSFTVTSPSDVVLNLKVFLEGAYLGNGLLAAIADPAGNPALCDSITVELRNDVLPFSLSASVKSTIDTNGNGNFIFFNFSPGYYYIVVKHRSALETWSKDPVLFMSPQTSFDFTSP